MMSQVELFRPNTLSSTAVAASRCGADSLLVYIMKEDSHHTIPQHINSNLAFYLFILPVMFENHNWTLEKKKNPSTVGLKAFV